MLVSRTTKISRQETFYLYGISLWLGKYTAQKFQQKIFEYNWNFYAVCFPQRWKEFSVPTFWLSLVGFLNWAQTNYILAATSIFSSSLLERNLQLCLRASCRTWCQLSNRPWDWGWSCHNFHRLCPCKTWKSSPQRGGSCPTQLGGPGSCFRISDRGRRKGTKKLSFEHLVGIKFYHQRGSALIAYQSYTCMHILNILYICKNRRPVVRLGQHYERTKND